MLYFSITLKLVNDIGKSKDLSSIIFLLKINFNKMSKEVFIDLKMSRPKEGNDKPRNEGDQ